MGINQSTCRLCNGDKKSKRRKAMKGHERLAFLHILG